MWWGPRLVWFCETTASKTLFWWIWNVFQYINSILYSNEKNHLRDSWFWIPIQNLEFKINAFEVMFYCFNLKAVFTFFYAIQTFKSCANHSWNWEINSSKVYRTSLTIIFVHQLDFIKNSMFCGRDRNVCAVSQHTFLPLLSKNYCSSIVTCRIPEHVWERSYQGSKP